MEYETDSVKHKTGFVRKKTHVSSGKEIPEIRLRDIWFRYERELPDVVKGLSLDVRKREIFALVGGNGTGKSTTMNLIARIRCPYRGKIWLEGKNIENIQIMSCITVFSV